MVKQNENHGPNQKILYFESINSHRKRQKSIIHRMYILSTIIFYGLIMFTYLIMFPIEGENPYLVLIICIPLGLGLILATYFKDYKLLNRIIIYNDGLYPRYGKKFIYFSEIKHFRLEPISNQPQYLHIYYGDNNHEWFAGFPRIKDFEKIRKIFNEKGISEKKQKKWYE